MPALDVRLLGPLEVRIDGENVAVPRGNTAAVLAILLDEANSVVPLEHLVRAVYGFDNPKDPETQVQNTIGVLRRKLGVHRDRVATVGSAYRFRIDIDELDLLRCKANDGLARRLKAEGDLAGAAAALREALAEWRGPALADLSGSTVESVRRRYDEHRLTLLERRIDLDLDLGRHAEVIEELRQIVAVHGTRQRFTAQLMSALRASGRSAEALEAFAALKDRLAEELGTDPDQRLRDLHTAILRDGSAPSEAGTPPAEAPFPRRVPAMLPRANTRFTGRSGQLGTLDGFLEEAAGTAGLAVVTGMGGVGKTALAVSWAHRVAHRFPDGQLYFNLRGFDPLAPGADPSALLGEALVALGVEAHRLPAGLDERIGLYRTALAQRSVLVVLDNARDAAQVRPLLPVAPGSFTLVTSRDRLGGLDMHEGAEVVPLELLSDADAWALLVRRIGMERALTEERAVLRIVASCGRLPLALTLIGAWAAAHPSFSLAALADRLDTTTNVFKVLSSSDLASDPRSVFACSYQALGTRAAQAFRLFGLHPGPDLTVAAMASLMGAPAAEAEAALSELADVHLVDQHREGRYTLHDLLRAYAKERYADEVAEDRRAEATRRMIEHYLFTANAVEAFLAPRSDRLDLGQSAPGVLLEPIGDEVAAGSWIDAEDQVLRGLIRLEPLRPEMEVRVWQLGWCMMGFLLLDRFRAEGRPAIGPTALTSADGVLGRITARGHLSGPLLLVSTEASLPEELAKAMELAAQDRDPGARAIVSYALTAGSGAEGRDAEALGYARQGLEYFRAHSNRYWANRMLYGVGWHTARLGNLDEARACFAQVQTDAPQEGKQLAKANTDIGFGYLAHVEGRFDAAIGHFTEAIAWLEANGLMASAASAREHLGDTRQAMGDDAAARDELRDAATVFESLGLASEAARVRAKIAVSA